jgi:hypothetical protein
MRSATGVPAYYFYLLLSICSEIFLRPGANSIECFLDVLDELATLKR